MEPLFTEEQTPSCGIIKDRIRPEDQIYEIHNFTQTYSMRGKSDKVVCAALIIATSVPTMPEHVIVYPKSSIDVPYSESAFNDVFGGLMSFIKFCQDNYDSILESLDSALPGDRLARKAYYETLHEMALYGKETEQYQHFISGWFSKHSHERPSFVDKCQKAAAALKDNRAVNLTAIEKKH